MKFYFAPMEGIGGYIYRNAYNEYFRHIDKYFAPFISTSPNGIRRMKEFRDILPENNRDIILVPQLLSNNAKDFVRAARELQEAGYDEINLNAGCPSGTVTSKGKGAGLLKDKEKLDEFLYDIFDQCTTLNIKLSIKTRIGFFYDNEFEEILDIYNRYPVYELIVHPRTREDYYKNKVNREAFAYAEDNSRNNICYNGDIFNILDYKRITQHFHNLETVMLGRGILRNPSIIENITGNQETPDWNKIFEFHDRLYHDYREYLSGDKNLLFKMKEIWLNMVNSMDNCEKCAKKIKKVKNRYEYESVIREFRQQLTGG